MEQRDFVTISNDFDFQNQLLQKCNLCKKFFVLNNINFHFDKKQNYYFKRCKNCIAQNLKPWRQRSEKSRYGSKEFQTKQRLKRTLNSIKKGIQEHGNMTNYLFYDARKKGKTFNNILKKINNIQKIFNQDQDIEKKQITERLIPFFDVFGAQDFSYFVSIIFPEKSWSFFADPKIKYALRYNLDVEFNAKERLRRQTTKAEKKDGIGDTLRSSVNNKRNSKTVSKVLGFTVKEFMEHFESLFTEGMDWNKFKDGKIHIDHVIPQDNFDLTKQKEWEQCWSLQNLQPLWAKDNLEKSNKLKWRKK